MNTLKKIGAKSIASFIGGFLLGGLICDYALMWSLYGLTQTNGEYICNYVGLALLIASPIATIIAITKLKNKTARAFAIGFMLAPISCLAFWNSLSMCIAEAYDLYPPLQGWGHFRNLH